MNEDKHDIKNCSNCFYDPHDSNVEICKKDVQHEKCAKCENMSEWKHYYAAQVLEDSFKN